MNREKANKAIKNGAIAACIPGVVTLALVIFAIISNADARFGDWNDPSLLFLIMLIFGCAYGIYKKSRFAAMLIFIFFIFIFAEMFIEIETEKLSGVGMGLVFLYFYGKAIQGTFAFHKMEKAENPYYKSTPKWAFYVGIPVMVILVALTIFGLMTMIGVVPSTEIQSGIDMLQKDKDTLIANNIISPHDNIQYFYSYGFTSILEGGSVLTDDRVMLYMTDENQEVTVYELYLVVA
jgi:MFS family permease